MPATILDYVYDHEAAHPGKVFLTQPIGGGRVVDYTWGQMMDQARRMAAHLRSFGFEPGARIAMLAKNSAHFFMVDLAVWMAGGTTVAIFPTETADNVRYVLDHSEASLLFVGKLDTWEQQKRAVPAGLPCIEMPLAPATGFPTWDEIVARTAPLPGRPARDPDDLAMLLYTSGSTGQPKGVMQSFGRITRTIECGLADTEIALPAGVEARALSYLPLAHSYERAVLECRALVDGSGHVFFADSLATFIDDIKRARPTTFISVPRLWLKFQQGVFAKMPPQRLDFLLRLPFVGKRIGRKVLEGLGLDQVRLAFSASAPIPPALLAWYRRLGLNLYEGYGMTEDFAYSHRTTARLNEPGYVGVASPGVQVRISDEGEILVKSPGQLVGYYKRPDLDAESFTADGFFRTGDLGELRPDGQLRLTGRAKELFKTAKGKYVAPAPIENRLLAHPMLELAMVSGVGQPAAYAVVVLTDTLRPRVGDPEVRAQAEAELTQLLSDVNEGLAPHERLRMLVVAREPWSIENGMLTPTMKIKRSRIEAAVAPQIEAWFAKPGPVLWA
jgi:long-chain acyl-CoA synthetase